jgi:hypothetical protein
VAPAWQVAPPALPVTPPPPGSACSGGSAALAGAGSPLRLVVRHRVGHFGLLLAELTFVGRILRRRRRQKALELTTVGDSQGKTACAIHLVDALQSAGAAMEPLLSKMRCGDVDIATKIGYMMFQSSCVRKIRNY